MHAALIHLTLHGQPPVPILFHAAPDFIQEQIKLVKGIPGSWDGRRFRAGRLVGVFTVPEGFDLAQLLSQAPQPLLVVDALQRVEKHRHANR